MISDHAPRGFGVKLRIRPGELLWREWRPLRNDRFNGRPTLLTIRVEDSPYDQGTAYLRVDQVSTREPCTLLLMSPGFIGCAFRFGKSPDHRLMKLEDEMRFRHNQTWRSRNTISIDICQTRQFMLLSFDTTSFCTLTKNIPAIILVNVTSSSKYLIQFRFLCSTCLADGAYGRLSERATRS